MNSGPVFRAGADMSERKLASPAGGGSLHAYGEWLSKSQGGRVFPGEGGTLWIPGVQGELMRFPMEYTGEAQSPALLRSLLRQPGVWLVSYQLEPAPGVAANCFDYVCRNAAYDIEGLPKNARRDIRRGLRSFTVRLCSWDELGEKGYPALLDTEARHNYARPAPDEVRRLADRMRASPFHEVWGAWKDGELAAWMIVIKIDDWACISAARSCTAALGGCPNNAIVFEVTRQAMVNENRRYVTYGLSSLQIGVNELSMHKFKTRMGYEALPMKRKFLLHPLLRPLLQTATASWLLNQLTRVRPCSAQLRKLAGMSRLLSGRSGNPLAWAVEAAGSSQDREE